MLTNCQNNEPVPNGVASPSKPVNPGPNTVIGRSSRLCSEDTFREVSSIEDETDEIRYDGWEHGIDKSDHFPEPVQTSHPS